MDLFPPFDAYRGGYLEVGDGHSLYWEESGNPNGIPVLFVHGGPGAGTAPVFRRFFDPDHWRIILIDQRGCGQSLPVGGLVNNTTQALIQDLEKLRTMLAVDRWMLFGGSWGSTLSLAYGQAHPDRVLGFVLRGVFLFRPAEVDWFLTGMGTFYPEAHGRFLSLVAQDHDDLLTAYYRRLTSHDPHVYLAAARYWCAYEEACARLHPRQDPGGSSDDACLAMARLECHYMVHGGFLTQTPLLEGMGRISHLPAIIVQGRHDVICPPVSAVDLSSHWPRARLDIIPDGCHSALEQPLRMALVDAVQTMRYTLG